MEYEFDVCLSFAGEQRAYVEKVYECLKSHGIKVFYDNDSDSELELWGNDLVEVFKNIYKKKARYCAMFISKEYGEKAWTRFERRSALERAIYEEQAYILPIRFDTTELPGLSDSVKCLDAQKKSPADIASAIIFKIEKKSDALSVKFIIEDYAYSIYMNLEKTISKEDGFYKIRLKGPESIQVYSISNEKEFIHLIIIIKEYNQIELINFDLLSHATTEKILTEQELYSAFTVI